LKKIDKTISALIKRVNLLTGSSPVSKWDNRPANGSPTTNSNWDMINEIIKENEGNSWFVPSEEKYNAWTCLAMFTIGNIELRDFALERKFADMRHARVKEYDRKWEEALAKWDIEYLNKHPSKATASVFWVGWTKEELDYYENEERFPILKDKNYTPNWRVYASYNTDNMKVNTIYNKEKGSYNFVG
jgi:hypothetical protein